MPVDKPNELDGALPGGRELVDLDEPRSVNSDHLNIEGDRGEVQISDATSDLAVNRRRWLWIQDWSTVLARTVWATAEVVDEHGDQIAGCVNLIETELEGAEVAVRLFPRRHSYMFAAPSASNLKDSSCGRDLADLQPVES